jgi:hypothetical protein
MSTGARARLAGVEASRSLRIPVRPSGTSNVFVTIFVTPTWRDYLVVTKNVTELPSQPVPRNRHADTLAVTAANQL